MIKNHKTYIHRISHAGFTLIDTLIAIAIFVLVSPALMQYFFGFNVLRFIYSVSGHSQVVIPAQDQRYFMHANISHNNADNFVPVDVSEKNCDIFASELFEVIEDNNADISIKAESIKDMEGDDVYISDNTFTSIEYIGKTNWGSYSILIGLNSASTSKPDLLQLSFDPGLQYMILKESKFLGPGVVDIDISPKVYADNLAKTIGIVERSLVTPFWIGAIDLNSQSAGMDIRSDIHLNLAGAYPTVVKQYGGVFIIGTQKSLWSELVVGQVNNSTGIATLLSDTEIGTGVNDVFMDNESIYIASAQNPELSVLELSESLKQLMQTVVEQQSVFVPLSLNITNFDAPGELGNGKSITPYPYGLFLGRTVGNQELYSIMHLKNSQNAISTNPNISIRKMIYVFDGAGLIVLTNSDSDAVKVYIQKSVGETHELDEIISLDLDAKPTDMVCIEDRLFVTTESQVSPLMSISISK